MSVKNIRHGISVAGVSWQAARGELFMYFKQFGSVKNINIHRDSYTGVSKGIARVHFRELESVKRATESNVHYPPDGSKWVVRAVESLRNGEQNRQTGQEGQRTTES
ncbi:SRA stem-loop-interacting RNA-binding protein, mitochondrial-like [Mya arenaria]|uniref:SRA stem-loop-interacting RNA-binding protein, mitochondrial-like n=1 Tax=Mya arenaria TaxID=6604 RepID=UPI0022DF82CF|nr:SRA stem-loop-interacting RNA-binding protein, mitochondrial-like [Mya arenaria]